MAITSNVQRSDRTATTLRSMPSSIVLTSLRIHTYCSSTEVRYKQVGGLRNIMVSHNAVVHIEQQLQTQNIDNTLYNSTLTIYRGLFSPNNSRETPIARPLGRLSWDPSLTEVLPSNLVYCVQYRVIWYRNISKVYSIKIRRIPRPHGSAMGSVFRRKLTYMKTIRTA